MAREIQADRSHGAVHLPKSVTRQGATQRDWILSRVRAVRRVIVVISFAAGTLFTGLALRHSLHPTAPVEAQTAGPPNQGQASQNQSIDVPSQSLFGNQTSSSFSVAPEPQVSTPRIRTVSS